MTLRAILQLPALLNQASAVIQQQNQKIASLEQELRASHLEHNREMQALVCSWLISLERPEVDMREDLATLERSLGNRVAELEEHVL